MRGAFTDRLCDSLAVVLGVLSLLNLALSTVLVLGTLLKLW